MDFLKELIEINNELTWKHSTMYDKHSTMYDKHSTHKYRLFTLSKDNMIPLYEKKILRLEQSKNLWTTVGDIQPSSNYVNCIQ